MLQKSSIISSKKAVAVTVTALFTAGLVFCFPQPHNSGANINLTPTLSAAHQQAAGPAGISKTNADENDKINPAKPDDLFSSRFSNSPWYSSLTEALGNEGPYAGDTVQKLSEEYEDDRMTLSTVANWIERDYAIRPVATASHVHDRLSALQDGAEPEGSGDRSIARFTWYPRLGTKEWVQYDFQLPWEISGAGVYWYDEAPEEIMRLPDSWELLYRTEEDEWKPVEGVDEYGTEGDKHNRITFDPVRTSALRIIVQLREGYSAGMLSWEITPHYEEQEPATALRSAVHSAIEVYENTGYCTRRFSERYDTLAGTGREEAAGKDWAELYLDVSAARRAAFLEPLLENTREIVFVKHHIMGGSHYAYTEALSDAHGERNWAPDSELAVLEMDGIFGEVRTLIEDRTGVIRDPDVSFDGKRILFSWKKSDRADDFSLYEMDIDSGQVRQLTSGLGYADYEGVYLPDGNIMFNSTRCMQIVDCWWTEVSNLFLMDGDGNYMRRVGYDQVHTNYPTVTEDGRVIYTRWDYNDRGQIFPQGLFQMFPDGTNQTEFYGNNSYFPTTLIHARGIPGTPKVMAVFTGHHTNQSGKLGIIDPSRGRQENKGAQLIAPVRETPVDRIDRWGQSGDQFQYPYPLTEKQFLISYSPGGNAPYGIYMMDIYGQKELLAVDVEDGIPYCRPVPLAPREAHTRNTLVDYRQETGTYFMQDIYEGPGLEGIERGTISALRVVALDYRAAGIGLNDNRAVVSTPIAVPGGSWDVKQILGTTKVHEDGSALFKVPARTPVFFQALDEKGHAVQSMRSWSTVQPGEFFSCVGCHEHKNTAPPFNARTAKAFKEGPQKLKPFYGEPRGFSYREEIQPILDKHCVLCHSGSSAAVDFNLTDEERPGATHSHDKRKWYKSYLNLTGDGFAVIMPEVHDVENPPYANTIFDAQVNWIPAQSAPPMLPPYFAGAARSPLIEVLEEGHMGVKLTDEEMDKFVTWIDLAVPFAGDYKEANAWSEGEQERYNYYYNKRKEQEEIEQHNIRELIEHKKHLVPGH